jgi:hypothetical protein
VIGKVIEKKGQKGKVGGRYLHGLIDYLVGPGEANEHSDPHLVAGSGVLVEAFAGSDWDTGKVGHLARVVDGDWRRARWAAGLTLSVPADGTKDARGPADPDHVFHATLSLHHEEGQLSDETWAQIVGDYMQAMEFHGVDGKADCQWIAVRHGLNVSGNDHIHLVASMVRADGTRWSDSYWKAKSRAAADAIEARYGLRPVRDHADDRGRDGYKAAEVARAKRADRPEIDRHQLARRIRAVAATSSSEVEFVRSVRESGLLIRPRFARGGTGEVIGYSAAVRPSAGERPVWFGGGRLDWLLALPRLRQRWQDSPQARDEALGEWRRRAEPAHPSGRAGPEWAGVQRVNVPLEAAREVARVNQLLAAVDPRDRVTWVAAAREASEVLAACSAAVEAETPGPLARAADALARAALPRRGETVPRLSVAMVGRHVRLLARARGPRAGAGWAAVLQQVQGTIHALQQSQMMRGERVSAQGVARDAVAGVDEVRRELATAAAPAPFVHREDTTRLHDPLRPVHRPDEHGRAGHDNFGR